MAIVYSDWYDISFFGLERLHPFDSRKYGRAWAEVRRVAGRHLPGHEIRVDRAANDKELLLAHTPIYLTQLERSKTLAAALEVPALRYLPGWLLRWRVVLPMRWAVRGTMLAARAALEHGWAANLSGGYHHAKPDRGEGFCLFSDIAIAVRQLRSEGLLRDPSRVVYVDLDAHQGNGVCHEFMNDREVFIFDMYNSAIYPTNDKEARRRIDCDLPLSRACQGSEYLGILQKHLPRFIDSVSRTEGIALGVYNAGTDVFAGDPAGWNEAIGVGHSGAGCIRNGSVSESEDSIYAASERRVYAGELSVDRSEYWKDAGKRLNRHVQLRCRHHDIIVNRPISKLVLFHSRGSRIAVESFAWVTVARFGRGLDRAVARGYPGIGRRGSPCMRQFKWIEWNLQKIDAHGLSAEEVEAAFDSVFSLQERKDGSFQMFAETPSGRRISVIWRYDREDDEIHDVFGELGDEPIFVITAY